MLKNSRRTEMSSNGFMSITSWRTARLNWHSAYIPVTADRVFLFGQEISWKKFSALLKTLKMGVI